MPTRPDGWKFEPQSVRGKAVLITGGTTGIGRATARLLAAEGANVMIFGREQGPLDDALADIRAVAQGQVHGLTADQANEPDIHRVFDAIDREFGKLDVLVANAALAAEDTMSMDYNAREYVVKTNLLGYMACARHAIERMQEHGGGHIVAIGSMSADVREKGSDVYVATKAAIQGWCEALRKEVNHDGIKVTLIEPGSVGTDMQRPEHSDRQQRKAEEKGEMLTAEDIAEMVHYALIQPERCDIVSVQIRPHLQAI